MACGIVCGRRLLCIALAAGTLSQVQAQDTERVARILAERCAACHQGEAAPNDLRLDSIGSLLRGSARGAVVEPGNPAGSELLRRIRGQSLPRMPLTGPPFLSDEDTAAVERWIAAGAPAAAAVAPAAADPAREPAGMVTYADVQPIFGTHCAKCHTDNGVMGPPPEGYRLNDYANTLATIDRARVVPGQPLASELLRRVRGLSRPRMPFDGPPYLTVAQIVLIERWIADGAPDAQGRRAGDARGAAVRLGGTLGADGSLDGLHFRFDAGRRDRLPPSGRTVELRGTVGRNGEIDVQRIRSR